MLRILALLVLLSASAKAQLPSEYGCFPYQPDDVEIAEIMMAATQVAPGAELLEACSEKVRPLVPIPGVEGKKIRVYSLLWPTDDAFKNVRILQRGECTRKQDTEATCKITPDFMAKSSAGEMIRLSRISSAVEINSLLEFRDRFLGFDYRLSHIRKISPLRTSTSGYDEATYEIGHFGRGYKVHKRCDRFAKCTWTSTPYTIMY